MNCKFLFIGTVILLLSWGCGRQSEPSPAERNRLVTGFFSSLASGDANAAALQGQKLYALNSHNDFVLRLVTIQKSNFAIQQAQGQINNGNISAALRILEREYRANFGSRMLRASIAKLRQLRNAPKLLQTMAKASSSAAMRSALTAASSGLSQNMTPELREYFRQYEDKIKSTVAKEQAAAVKPAVNSKPDLAAAKTAPAV